MEAEGGESSGGADATTRPTTRQTYMRLFRDQVRTYLLRERAFEFIPEDPEEEEEGPTLGRDQGIAEAAAASLSEEEEEEGAEGSPHLRRRGHRPRREVLCVDAVGASSQDDEDQGPGNLLTEDRDTFWSSVGRGDPDAAEALVFRLAGPLCTVECVEVAVYRARFQFGEPIYPCAEVSVEVLTRLPREAKALGIFDGAGLVPGGGRGSGGRHGPFSTARFRVGRHARVQRFALPGWAQRTGGYVVVRLRGFLQRQLEDNLLYVALRMVQAHGTRCLAHRVPRAERHVRLGTQCGAPSAGAGLWLGDEGTLSGISPGTMACLLGEDEGDTVENVVGDEVGEDDEWDEDSVEVFRADANEEEDPCAEEDEDEEEAHARWTGWGLRRTLQRWTTAASGQHCIL